MIINTSIVILRNFLEAEKIITNVKGKGFELAELDFESSIITFAKLYSPQYLLTYLIHGLESLRR